MQGSPEWPHTVKHLQLEIERHTLTIAQAIERLTLKEIKFGRGGDDLAVIQTWHERLRKTHRPEQCKKRDLPRANQKFIPTKKMGSIDEERIGIATIAVIPLTTKPSPAECLRTIGRPGFQMVPVS